MSEQNKTAADQPVAVVTGASAGIGKATAAKLVAQGWKVIGVGRNPQRCAEAEKEIRAAAANGGAIEFVRADFDCMAEVMAAAEEIKQRTGRLDALVNNAGGVRDRQLITAEGTEATFAANHLAPFLLTRELLPLLRETGHRRPGAARVIAVSSSAHRRAENFDWDDLQLLGRADFNPGVAYCQAKLANLLFTRELARRVAADGIVAQCMHPGVVDSNFASHGDQNLQAHMRSQPLLAPDVPADTLVWLTTADDTGPAGRYFYNLEEEEPAAQGLNDADAARLWQETEKLLTTLGY